MVRGTSSASAILSASSGEQVDFRPEVKWLTIDFEQPEYRANRSIEKFRCAIKARSVSVDWSRIQVPFGHRFIGCSHRAW